MDKLFLFKAGCGKKQVEKFTIENWQYSAGSTWGYLTFGFDTAPDFYGFLLDTEQVFAHVTPRAGDETETSGNLIVAINASEFNSSITVILPPGVSHMKGDLNFWFVKK